MKTYCAFIALHLAIILLLTTIFIDDMATKIIFCIVAIIIVESLFILSMNIIDRYQFRLNYAERSTKEARESMIDAREELFFFQQQSKFLRQVNINKYKRAERQRITDEIMKTYTTGKLISSSQHNVDSMTSYPLSLLGGQTMI